ncbi:MAG: tetratricopeptide repeat protein [Pirellulaceae bacterium]|nr:tetratricopeptide repeat protein [Pirellulaceae bacterium]
MRASAWILCVWPGLAALWLRGRWSGLGTAIAFGMLLNASLLAQFASRQPWHPSVLGSLWLAVAGVWCGGLWWAIRLLRQGAAEPARALEQDLFIQAQGEYLRGHWFEAEALLERLLRSFPDDVDGRLMLASIYRHTRRWDEASRQLDRLQRLERSSKWQLEIMQERKLLARLGTSAEASAAA